MSEIESTEIKQIELEINFYKGQAVQSIFEIGERLIKAKELVAHGEWENWLKDKVDFSGRQARRFIQVAEEFPNRTTSATLGQSKIFELMALPKEEIETFIEENPVEDMTNRELRQAVKEKNQLKQELEEAKHKHNDLLAKNLKLANQEPVVIEKEVIKEVVPEHLKDKLIDLEEDKKELERLRQAGMDLKQYNSQRLDIDKQIREKTKEYEELMNTMRRLEESYDEKNSRLTVQANLINKIKIAVKPLKELNAEIERLFNLTGELDAISTKEAISEVESAYKVLELIEGKIQNINVEVLYYEKQ